VVHHQTLARLQIGAWVMSGLFLTYDGFKVGLAKVLSWTLEGIEKVCIKPIRLRFSPDLSDRNETGSDS